MPKDKKPIGCKWIFKEKRNDAGKVERHKARLVVKGYTQKYGTDYEETFAPVVKFSSIRMLLTVATQNNIIVHQMDVDTAFLNGTIDEEIFMEQPPGYTQKGNEHVVCNFNKSIYGLKQASRCWNNVFTKYVEGLQFRKGKADHCIFVRDEADNITIIAVYVDDLILVTKNTDTMDRVKAGLVARFRMKDFGKLHHCLGLA
jgi:hypothetical protein